MLNKMKSRLNGKIFLQSLFFFMLVTQICFAQWFWQNPLPQGHTLRSVKFISSSVGWAVGDDGTILKTLDGGTTWFHQTSGTNDVLRGVFFTDLNNGVAVGGYYPYNGTILRTSNGGDTWISSDSVYGEWHSVYFTDQYTGTVVAASGKILRTTNGGATWIEQMSGLSGEQLNSVFFTDEFTGTVVGSSGAIIKTTNGGTTWSQQTSGTTSWLYGVSFTDANNGIAVGESGTILQTTNGGTTWTQQTTGTYATLNSVCFSDANNGTAVGDAILITTDGGTSWNIQSYSPFDLYGVFFANVNIGTAVGSCGTILHTTDAGANWTTQTTGPRLGLNAVSFANTYDGIVVGEDGTILRTTNGGTNWTAQSSGTTVVLNDVSYVNSNIAIVVGSQGRIFRTTNGGTNWIQLTSGTTSELYGVSFTDPNTGTSVGSGGTIIRTTNGGVSWFTQTSGTYQSLNSVSFTDANTGTAVGTFTNPFSPAILRTTNGGITWVQQNCYINANLQGVCFTDANNGTAVGDWGRIIRTTNGGTYWEQQTAPFGWHRDVWFIDENVGYIVGSEILKTTNGGTTWVMQQSFISPSGTGTTLSGVHFIDADNGTAVGDCGAILRTWNGGVPVELTLLTASINDNDVLLSWSTATETNNSGFSIERKSAKSEYTEIGFAAGFGTTTEPKSYSYTDSEVSVGRYTYRLKQIDFNGSFEYSPEVEVEVAVPLKFALEQNYPNPFNPSTTIEYSIPEMSKVSLIIFNLLGEEVATLINEEKSAGNYTVEFNASSISGSVSAKGGYPSGVYFYQLRASSFIQTKKMLLLK